MMQFVILVYDDERGQQFSTKFKMEGVEPLADYKVKMTEKQREEMHTYAVSFAAQNKVANPVYAVFAYRYENGNHTMQIRRLEDIKQEFASHVKAIFQNRS